MKTRVLLLTVTAVGLFTAPLRATDTTTNFGGMLIERTTTYTPTLLFSPVTDFSALYQSTNQNSELGRSTSGGVSSSRMLTLSLSATGSLINIDFGDGTTNTGFAAIGQTTNDVWNAYYFPGEESAEMSDLLWADGSNSGVTLDVNNGAGLWDNGVGNVMYNSYIYPDSDGDIIVSLSNLTDGFYDVYIYGHGPSVTGNGVFDLYTDDADYNQRGTTVWGAGWNSTNWEEGQQYVLYKNVSVSGGNMYVDVMPNFDGLPLIAGMQIVVSGTVIDPPMVAEKILNIDHTGTVPDIKTGIVAVGQTTNDFWNRYEVGSSPGLLTNLLWADGVTNSGVGLKLVNATGVWGNGIDDKMFNSYDYTYAVNITNIFTNIPSGEYDFYLYGHGPEDGNSVFQLTSGTTTFVTKGTTMWGSFWNSTNWDESQQFVIYRDVTVDSNQPVVITVFPGISGYTIINGIQIVLPLDRDGNGLPDWWERLYFGHTGVDLTDDPDHDGLTNLQEFQHGTSPTNPDSDGDGVPDGIEVIQGRSPTISGTVSDTGNQIKLQVYTPLH